MIDRDGILSTHNYPALYFDIAFKRLMDEFRRNSRFNPLEVEVVDLHEYEPLISMSFDEQREILKGMLTLYINWDNKYGRILFERFILKFSNAEIAERRNMTEGSVAATLSTKMTGFKKWLEAPARSNVYISMVTDLCFVKGWWWEWQKEYPWNL